MDSDNSIPDAIQIGDETQPRTLYVGNLDAQMTEEFLVVLFSQIGPVKGCKIIHEVFLVVGSTTILWELASAHRPPPPPPPRHALRLQRMAPRLPHHHRPPRHHQHHPNMIQNQQGKPPRSYKPRLHLPFFNGLTGGRGPPPNRPHHHHHHHHPHHGPHHHHHGAPGGHPGHPGHHGHHHHHHQNHPGHAHHGPPGGHQNMHPQQQPQFHPPTRQQLSAGSQVPQRQPMFPYGGIPGVRPPQPPQHQQPFGYPTMDTTPAHTSPAANPMKHQAPLRQFAPQGPPSGPQFGFHQDPEIPFGEGQELPSTTGSYQQQQQQQQQKQQQQHQQQQHQQQQQQQQQHQQQQQQQQTSNAPAQPAIQQTTSAYGETSTASQGNGFLGSQYKGWKPIAKPFQSSYPRGPGGDQHPPAGLHDFARGPPQDFPQLSDNNLPAFPMHDFPSGPSGPPGPPQHHQHHPQQLDFPRGPQIENMLEAFGIPDPPQIPNFSRAPQQQHLPSQHHQQQIHLPDFPQHPHPHDGPIHFSPPYRGNHAMSHHPGHHGGIGLGQQLGGGGGNGLLGFHQHSSPNPHDYGQVSSTTPRDIFPQFLPSGGGIGGGPSEDYNNLNTNTLFRENIMHMKPNHGNQNQNIHHSPGANDVVVPLPAEIGDSVRLPNSLFTDNQWTQNNREQHFEASQSEENIVVKKPKFSFKNKLNQQNNGGGGGGLGGSSDETVESPAPHSILPKFKQRPRLNKDGDHKDQNGQNLDGSQKLSQGSDEQGLGGGPPGQGQRNKLNGGRGRVRIRTRLRRPNPFSNSGEDNDNNDGNNNGGTTSFPPFPGSKNDSPRRPIFRKQQNEPQRDNNLSTESPNNSAGDGPPGPPGPPPPALGGPPNDRPQGPISEELSNFPTLPFPPPDPDFIRDFPSAPAPVPPPPPPPPPPSKERDLPSRLSGLGRPQNRGPPQVNSGEQNNRGIEGPPGPRDGPRDGNRDGNQGGGRLNIGRRRRPRPKPQPEQDDQSDVNHQENSSGQQHRQRGNSNDRDSNNPQTTPPVVGLNNDAPLFSGEFFFPPGFSQDPTKHSGDNPVSFITMPNAKPQVIHHNILQTHSQEQQGNPPHHNGQSPSISHPPPQHNFNHHQGNQYRGPPQTQHFPQLEDFGQQGLPQIPFGRQPHHGPHHGHHGLGPPPNHQLSAYSDHLPFARPPQRGRKPHRGNHPPQSTKAPTPQQVLNPYAYPTTNPYAVPPSGPYLPSGPFEHQHLDNAPQTSNSYEVPDGGMFGARPPPSGPVYHAPPPHHGPGLVGPVPSPLPPQRPSHPPPPGRGRLPGGGRGPPHHPMQHHGRKPPVQSDPVVMSQSVEFEQIPAQYLDANNLPPPSPVAPVVVAAPPQQQETPAFSDKPHEHHSPDIHPPGNFFDEFFKPFEGEPAAPGGPTNRVDGMEPHDEQQSNSNVNLKVVPSPKNGNKTEEGSSKPWNKSKLSPKDSSKSTSEPTSSEKPGRPGKKPINGRFHPKNHLKAKIADIARKNFQSHMVTAPVEGEEGEIPVVTTYKPSLLDSNNNGSATSTNPGDQHHSSAKDSITKFRHSESDDQIDTNTPRSTIRYSSKTDSGPMLIHHRGKNRNDDQHQQDHHTTDGTTILFKSKRQFRRKRPGQQQKDKDARDNNGDQQPHNTHQHELSTTTRSALRAAHSNLNKGENVSKTLVAESVVKEGSEGSTTRVGVLRRRKLFPRRRNFSLSSKVDRDTTKDATPTPAEDGESVTYGESQWFRVKNHDDTSSLSTPAPTPESKTVPVDAELPAASSHLPGGDVVGSSSVVSSSSKMRKNPHHLSESTTITSSTSSSSSDSGRPFPKKSSKFIMNRLTMA